MKLEEKILSNLEDMAYNDYHINAGIERIVNSKVWKKNGKARKYFSIDCFTAYGNSKGSYKCGYIDLDTDEYVCTEYDHVNAIKKEYVGK